jgi:hypothetical protein
MLLIKSESGIQPPCDSMDTVKTNELIGFCDDGIASNDYIFKLELVIWISENAFERRFRATVG